MDDGKNPAEALWDGLRPTWRCAVIAILQTLIAVGAWFVLANWSNTGSSSLIPGASMGTLAAVAGGLWLVFSGCNALLRKWEEASALRVPTAIEQAAYDRGRAEGLEAMQRTAEKYGVRLIDNGRGNLVSVEVIDEAKLRKKPPSD
jgi:hypothetical protein